MTPTRIQRGNPHSCFHFVVCPVINQLPLIRGRFSSRSRSLSFCMRLQPSPTLPNKKGKTKKPILFLVDARHQGKPQEAKYEHCTPLSYPTKSTDPIVSRYNDAPVHGHRRAEPPKRQISRSPARSHRSTSVPFAHTLSLSFHPPSPPFS